MMTLQGVSWILVIETANGKETQTERRGYRSISIFKDGVVL